MQAYGGSYSSVTYSGNIRNEIGVMRLPCNVYTLKIKLFVLYARNLPHKSHFFINIVPTWNSQTAYIVFTQCFSVTCYCSFRKSTQLTSSSSYSFCIYS